MDGRDPGAIVGAEEPAVDLAHRLPHRLGWPKGETFQLGPNQRMQSKAREYRERAKGDSYGDSDTLVPPLSCFMCLSVSKPMRMSVHLSASVCLSVFFSRRTWSKARRTNIRWVAERRSNSIPGKRRFLAFPLCKFSLSAGDGE